MRLHNRAIAGIGVAVAIASSGAAALATTADQQAPAADRARPAVAGATADGPAPVARPRDVAAQGRILVNRFWRNLVTQDRRAMAALLSPAFQVQRADGSHSRRRDYLRRLPKVRSFTVSNRVTTYATGALVVRYDVTTEEIVGGVPFRTEAAPRLSTFVWTGAAWRMTSHANFNRPS